MKILTTASRRLVQLKSCVSGIDAFQLLRTTVDQGHSQGARTHWVVCWRAGLRSLDVLKKTDVGTLHSWKGRRDLVSEIRLGSNGGGGNLAHA